MLRYQDDLASYLLRDPVEVVDSGFFGPCLRAEFQVEGERQWWGPGDFRLDRCVLIEPVGEQMEMKEAA